MTSKAKYSKYKVKVKWILTEKLNTIAKVFGFQKRSTSYRKHIDTVTYNISPSQINKQLVNFGRIQTSYSASSVFGIMGGSTTSEFTNFKYEIINITPIN